MDSGNGRELSPFVGEDEAPLVIVIAPLSLDYFFPPCLFAIVLCFFLSEAFDLDCFWFLSFCFDFGDLSPMIFDCWID